MPVRKTGQLPENVDRQVNEIIRAFSEMEEQIAKLSQGLRQQTDETEGLSNQSYLMDERLAGQAEMLESHGVTLTEHAGRLDEQETSLATIFAGLAILEAFRQSLIGLLIPRTLILPGTPGFIAPTGALLNRAEWPIFWPIVEAGNNIVTDAEWHNEKRFYSYSYGDGETTFRIPMIYDFVRGYNPANGVPIGQWVEDTFATHRHDVLGPTTIGDPVHFGSSSNNGFCGHAGGNPIYRTNNSTGVPFIQSTGGPETAPKHGLLPYYIYTGEVW